MTSTTSIYQLIRDHIAHDIATGHYHPNERLPSERILIETFACTRTTLRQALHQLETEGLIYRENRRGWFISPARVLYNPSRVSSFMSYVATQGYQPYTEYLQAEQRPAGAYIAKKMKLATPEEPIFFLKRRRWVDQRPVLLEYNALLVRWCPQLFDEPLAASLTKLLKDRFSKVQTRCEISLQTGILNRDQSDLLQATPNIGSLYLQRASFDEQERIVEFDQEFWRSDAVLITMETHLS